MLQSSLPPTGRRSVLCVPATDPHRIAKALASGADEVVVDLEDAVPLGAKAQAREVLAGFDWSAHARPRSLAVRVNAAGTPWLLADVEAVVRGGVPVDSLVLPKVETRDDVRFAERLLDGLEKESGVDRYVRVQALVETAAGVTGLADIVRDRERLIGLILGYADLASSLGRTAAAPAATWLPIQLAVLCHARAAGIEAVDGPYLGVGVDDDFRAAVEVAAAIGFDAKWAIHPRQIPALSDAFGPSDDDLTAARRLLDALADASADGRGAIQLDGALVDEAMAVGARRLLAKAGR